MYRNGTKLQVSEYNFVFQAGGIGDLLGQLPAVEYSLKYHQQLKINMVVHDYAVDLCKKVFNKYGDRIKVLGMTEAKEEVNYDPKLQARSPYAHKISNLSWHITDHAFATLLGKDVEDKHKNYIQMEPIDVSSFNLPEKYVVITSAFTSNTREFKPEYVKEISDYCITRGYEIIYLGKSYTQAYNNTGIVGNIKCDYSNGRNLIDLTTLFEAHSIMANAKLVVGVDNGLLHLACMSDVPVIFGCTTVDPNHRLPFRKNERGWNCYPVVPPKNKVECRFCQSNWSFAHPSFSFTDCGYKDFLCTKEIIPSLWIEQINKII